MDDVVQNTHANNNDNTINNDNNHPQPQQPPLPDQDQITISISPPSHPYGDLGIELTTTSPLENVPGQVDKIDDDAPLPSQEIDDDDDGDDDDDDDGDKPLNPDANIFQSILPPYDSISNWQVPLYYTVFGLEMVGLWFTSILGLDSGDYQYVLNAGERIEAMNGARAPQEPNN